MKQQLFISIFVFCTTTYAQVPRQERMQEREEIHLESDYVVEAIPMDKTAADEVRGISYENDGKKSFVMGDETKKGLYDQINFERNSNSYIVKNGTLYGIANKKAEITVKIEYDSIGADYSKGPGFVVKQKGKYGKITSTGKIILPIKYDKIIAANQYITLVYNKGDTQLIFNEHQKTLKMKIEYVELYQNLALVKSDGKFGVVKNEIIVPFEYDSIFLPVKKTKQIPNNNNKAIKSEKTANPLIRPHQNVSHLTLQKENKLGLINSDGKTIYPVDNDEVNDAETYGYFSVKKANLFGIYFSQSKEKKKTEIEFDHIVVDGYGAIMASKNKKMGIFNLNGEQITPFEYDNDFIAQYSGIGYRVSKDKKRGIIDNQGIVIVPTIYDDVSPFSYSKRDVFKVKNDDKYGIVNRKGDIIIPVNFEYIDELKNNYLVITPERKAGIYDSNGNVIVPIAYEWIYKTASQNSTIIVLKKDDYSFNFLDEHNNLIFPENVIEFGYVLDEHKLKNSKDRNGLLYVKTSSGKFGLLNEITGKIDVPTVYDQIIQSTSPNEKHSYFSVQNGKKYGLINEKNEVLIPIIYDAIDLTFAISTAFFHDENENKANDFQIVLAKGNKFGTVNLRNEVIVPFQYSYLQRISYSGLFKAKTGKQYQIIDKDGKLISKNTFDEVANFERNDENFDDDFLFQSLTFSNGKMRVIDNKGNFISSEIKMQPHIGYETFDELKLALIKALDSKDDELLKELVNKIAPSEHILYYLKQNLFDKSTLYVNIEYVKEKYLLDLLAFKYSAWNADTSLGYLGYKRSSLDVVDYTSYSGRSGIVTNKRTSDQAYGDTRFMEKLLRDAIKINGFWISTYFMKSGFERF